MPRTTLPWPSYKEKAEALYKKGLKFKEIKEILGDPYWEGKPWHVKNTGGGVFGRMDLIKRRRNQKDNTANRKRAEKITLREHRTDSENKRQLNLQKKQRAEANRTHGRRSHHLDHRYSQHALNQATNHQGPRLRGRTIRKIEAETGHPVGEHYKNKELVRAEFNQEKNAADLKANPRKPLSKSPDYFRSKNLNRLQQLAKFTAKRGPGMVARGVVPWLGYAPDLDERFGGHLDKAIKSGMDHAQAFGALTLQRLVDAYASSKPSVSGSNTDYGQ